MISELAGNIITRGGEILLLYREDEGWWDVPGGKVEEDESPTEAAEREAEEELGVEVELERPFFSGEFQHRDTVFLWHGYVASIEDGASSLEEEKLPEMRWMPADELDGLELAPNLEMILPALRKL